MSAFFVAGIDGGQSGTSAAVGDGDGYVIAHGSAGPADEVGQEANSTRLHDALRAALDAARERAGLPSSTLFDVVVAGISGYEGRVYGKPPDLPAKRLVLLHDAPVAHAGALGGAAGVTVIAGTGSVVFARGAGAPRTYGGWGYLFGDEGSAFWIARKTLAALMRTSDEAGDGGDAAAACAFFGVPTLRALARAVYAGEIARERVAAFAREVLTAADSPIVREGVARIAGLAATAVRDGAPALVAATGGLTGNPVYRGALDAALRSAIRGVRIVEPAYDPSVGALLLAYREAGHTFRGVRA